MGKDWNYQVAGTFTVTTTGNIDDLDFQKCSVIRMNNASLSTIRGLKAGYPGQEVSIVSIGAGQVNLAHQNNNSAAANRLINFVTSGITPLAAGSGTCILKYDETTARWRLINHNQGAWIAVAFDAANFTASTGNWTLTSPDQVTFSYWIKDNTLLVVYSLVDTTVSATPVVLQITIPNGWTAAVSLYRVTIAQDNGGAQVSGLARLVATTGVIFLYPTVAQATNWSASTNATAVNGDVLFQIA